MALFSRRKKIEDVPDKGVEPGEQPVAPTPADAAVTDAAIDGSPADAAAHPAVEISVSTFRGLGSDSGPGSADRARPVRPDGAEAPEPDAGGTGAAAPPLANGARGSEAPRGSASGSGAAPREPQPVTFRRGPAEAPPPAETIPGLRDNVLLAAALRALPAQPAAPDLMNVVRQLLQNHVFLRVHGDARALLAESKPLPLAVVERGGKQFVLVYSGGAALAAAVNADGDTSTSAMAQPVLAVIRHVLSGSAQGIVLDHSSAPARAVLPRPILERALAEADPELRVKTLLTAPRTDATAADVVAALLEAPLWIAVMRSDDGAPAGVAELRTAEGERFLEVFSHPLEALVLQRGDQALPVTVAQLASALARDEGLTGVMVDPGGPWIRLSRSDLAPVLARAEDGPQPA